ncbi:MAG TPA: hypothetical protein QGF63_08670 [Alphaproteobacteria bacterium]|jgi:hypothetical protein|nr:hypothetical protein [Alphaproteobacteria bacterium]HJM49911.1 hypothetical protein [Alphaproteobacteria bacterium]
MAGDNEGKAELPAGPAAAGAEAPSGAAGPGFKLVPQAGPVPETYADGAHGALSRGPIFKLEFYSAMGHDPESGDELWRPCQRLVLPVTAVPQMINILQRLMQQMEEAGVLSREAAPPPPGDG